MIKPESLEEQKIIDKNLLDHKQLSCSGMVGRHIRICHSTEWQPSVSSAAGGRWALTPGTGMAHTRKCTLAGNR